MLDQLTEMAHLGGNFPTGGVVVLGGVRVLIETLGVLVGQRKTCVAARNDRTGCIRFVAGHDCRVPGLGVGWVIVAFGITDQGRLSVVPMDRIARVLFFALLNRKPGAFESSHSERVKGRDFGATGKSEHMG